MPDLDALYGPPIAAHRMGTHEYRRQRSWLRVDLGDGAERLRTLLDSAASGAYLCDYLSQDFNTLWLIGQDGGIHVAIEEIVLDDHPDFLTAPMPKRYRARLKLGHPSLVEGGMGRIGGELHLNLSDKKCYLTNQSGRFGYDNCSEAQLEAAASAFRSLGIDVIARHEKRTW